MLRIRADTGTSRPCGSESCVNTLEKTLSRTLR